MVKSRSMIAVLSNASIAAKAALAVLQQIHDKDNVTALIAALESATTVEARMPLITALLRLYQREHDWDGVEWWGTRPNSAGPYFRGVTWEGSREIAKALQEVVKGMDKDTQKLVLEINRYTKLPVVIFPGDVSQITDSADALLFFLLKELFVVDKFM